MPATTRSTVGPGARAQRAQRRDIAKEDGQQKKTRQLRSGAVAKGAKKVLRQRGPEFAFEIGKTETRPDGTTVNLCSAPGCAREARPHSRFEPTLLDNYPTDKFSTIKHWCSSDTCLKLVCTLAGRVYRGNIMRPSYTPTELETAAPEDSTPDLKFAASLHARLKTVERAQRGLTAFTTAHLEAYDPHARDHIPSDYSPSYPGDYSPAPLGHPGSDGYLTPAYSDAADGYITPAYSDSDGYHTPSYKRITPQDGESYYSPVESTDAPSDDDIEYNVLRRLRQREHLLGHPNEGGHTPSGIPGACLRGSCAGCLRAGCYDQS